MLEAIGTALGPIMRFCFGLTGNYALSIILFTFITKIILFPTGILTQINSIKMVKMMPEENALKIKYIDDKDRLADERLALYKKYKYNPFISTIPLLIQIPLILGLVYIIYHPLDFTVGLPSDTIAALKDWLISAVPAAAAEENTYQTEIITAIQHGSAAVPADLSSAAETIRGLNMNFLGMDLSVIPTFTTLFIIPVLSTATAWLMCFVQNRINVLQIAQTTLNKILTSLITIGFSAYFAFLVPAGVGLYWIFGNIFAIPSMVLLNVVIPPKKHIDYDYLLKMNAQRIEKEKLHKQYVGREKADYKRFFSVENMKLMFYSESNGFYKYFAGMIDYICERSDLDIHYVTSDPNDKIFDDKRKNIHAYYVASDKYLIPLFMKLDCDMCVMTMPDLEKYHIKRSRVRKDVEYIFVSHGMGSQALTLRKGALDWFDTIFCPGVDTVEEIRDSEELYNTPKKLLVETGYPLIDDMIAKYNSEEHKKNEVPLILIAPSWQPDNIIDSCADELLNELRKRDCNIILRPHPQQVRHEPEKFEDLKEKYREYKNVEIQTDFSSNNPIMESDILITDWSDISWEFAFVTKRPVLFIDTPMKEMNPEWDKIKTKPINITLRDVIGRSIKPEDVSTVNSVIDEMFADMDKYKEVIDKTHKEHVFNIGRSSELCGRYIVKRLRAAKSGGAEKTE